MLQWKIGFSNYKFQFITLADFHTFTLNYGMYTLARARLPGPPVVGLSVELQQAEFGARAIAYSTTKHQRGVGTGYFDALTQIIGKHSSLSALEGSTEDEQFLEVVWIWFNVPHS